MQADSLLNSAIKRHRNPTDRKNNMQFCTHNFNKGDIYLDNVSTVGLDSARHFSSQFISYITVFGDMSWYFTHRSIFSNLKGYLIQFFFNTVFSLSSISLYKNYSIEESHAHTVFWCLISRVKTLFTELFLLRWDQMGFLEVESQGAIMTPHLQFLYFLSVGWLLFVWDQIRHQQTLWWCWSYE